MKQGKQLILTLVAVAAVVVGCGGSSDNQALDDSPAPSASVAPSTGHTEESGESALVDVPGFVYGDNVGPVAQVCDVFSADVISECSVHTVTQLGNGYLIVMGFAPDVPLGDDAAADMVKGMVPAGGQVKLKKVDGEDVAVIDAGDGKTLIAGWAHDRTMYMAQGEDGDALEEYVTGYITQQNA